MLLVGQQSSRGVMSSRSYFPSGERHEREQLLHFVHSLDSLGGPSKKNSTNYKYRIRRVAPQARTPEASLWCRFQPQKDGRDEPILKIMQRGCSSSDPHSLFHGVEDAAQGSRGN